MVDTIYSMERDEEVSAMPSTDSYMRNASTASAQRPASPSPTAYVKHPKIQPPVNNPTPRTKIPLIHALDETMPPTPCPDAHRRYHYSSQIPGQRAMKRSAHVGGSRWHVLHPGTDHLDPASVLTNMIGW